MIIQSPAAHQPSWILKRVYRDFGVDTGNLDGSGVREYLQTRAGRPIASEKEVESRFIFGYYVVNLSA